MTGAPEISNQKITEYSVQQGGKSNTMLRMTFNVDGHGPFSIEFAKEGFDPNTAKQQLQAFAQKIHQLGAA